jgi:hypothetical protein
MLREVDHHPQRIASFGRNDHNPYFLPVKIYYNPLYNRVSHFSILLFSKNPLTSRENRAIMPSNPQTMLVERFRGNHSRAPRHKTGPCTP